MTTKLLERMNPILITWIFLSLLGVNPASGRTIGRTESEQRISQPRQATGNSSTTNPSTRIRG